MTNQTTQAAQAETTAEAKVAKYKTQRAKRTRFSFGNVWLNAVLAGVVNDHDKLIAHAVELKIGRKYDLAHLKFETLLSKVQAKLLEPADAAESAAEATAEGQEPTQNA